MATKTRGKDQLMRLEPIDWEWVRQRAHEVYDPIKDELAKEHFDKVCAVEAKSGEYFIGENAADVVKKGRKKHPDGWFFFFRIGRKTFASMRGWR
ncbi:MAG: hypothetical protein NZT92_05890 [Abditibacteriales bacterium]|nr:hypothetical protein [Abditibacteriales bacterium]MDW8364825.1 hypothetical protein [Abditibacteriales bacterium]